MCLFARSVLLALAKHHGVHMSCPCVLLTFQRCGCPTGQAIAKLGLGVKHEPTRSWKQVFWRTSHSLESRAYSVRCKATVKLTYLSRKSLLASRVGDIVLEVHRVEIGYRRMR